jgi:hypothetical protein
MADVEQLHKKAAALKAEYMALDPATIREGLSSIIGGPQMEDLITKVRPLYEALPDGDPIKTHVASWLQVNLAVPSLIKQLGQ